MRTLLSLAAFSVFCASACAQTSPSLQAATDLYVKGRLENSAKVGALRAGDIIDGTLAQDIYSGEHELFRAGSRISLTVDGVARRRRVPNDHWPWVIKAFTPRHETYPTFRSATLTSPNGKRVGLRVSLISIGREILVRSSKSAQPSTRATVVTLEAANPASSAEAVSRDGFPGGAPPASFTLAGGTEAKIILLGAVSASRSQPGDSFQARVVEPVLVDSKVVLPEGSMLGGKVVSRTPPRMLSRAGSLFVVFTDLTLPGMKSIPMSASVASVDVDQRSHMKIDPEGKLHGDRPGKLWMAINLGVTGGIAKEADDATQLVMEAVVSAATDASTAGAARIAGICASSIFMLTRRGRDVVLPKFTEMNIVFDRPLALVGPTSVSTVP